MTLKEALEKLLANRDEIYSVVGEVSEIDNTKKTCKVKPINGSAELLDVRLQAGDGKGVIVYPKLGSIVIVTFLAQNTGYVALCSDIDKIEIEIDQQKLLIDNTGFDIEGALGLKSQISDLKSAIGELIDFITNIQVVGSAGNSVLLPALAPQLVVLKNKFNSFLK